MRHYRLSAPEAPRQVRAPKIPPKIPHFGEAPRWCGIENRKGSVSAYGVMKGQDNGVHTTPHRGGDTRRAGGLRATRWPLGGACRLLALPESFFHRGRTHDPRDGSDEQLVGGAVAVGQRAYV